MALILVGCGVEHAPDIQQQAPQKTSAAAVTVQPLFAVQWMDAFAAQAASEGLSAPARARAFAYLGVAMHEITRFSGSATLPSLASQLNGLAEIPLPPAGADWNVALAAAMCDLADVFFTSSFAAKSLRDKQLAERQTLGVSAEIIKPSTHFGWQVAAAIAAWAGTDGFDESVLPWSPIPGESHWEGTPTQPTFGQLRPFALATSDDCRAHKPAAFSTDTDSTFYQEAKQVMDAVAAATAADRVSIGFWADEASHWVSVASQRLRRDDSRLARAGKTYALVGLVLADSYVTAWQDKFRYQLLRPETYVKRYINASWAAIGKAGETPEYVSSQAVASAAAAQVMTLLYGDGAIDDSGRSYPSYWDAAIEAAETDLVSGVSFPMSIDAGMTSGVCVARALLDRVHI